MFFSVKSAGLKNEVRWFLAFRGERERMRGTSVGTAFLINQMPVTPEKTDGKRRAESYFHSKKQWFFKVANCQGLAFDGFLITLTNTIQKTHKTQQSI